jgi:EpsI family protein
VSDGGVGPLELSVEALGGRARDRRKQTLLTGASLVVMLAAFWPTLASFGSVWERPLYSFAYPTALLALWLLWRRRDALLDGSPCWAAALPLLGLSLVWMAATVMDVQVVHEGVLPLLVLAWVAVLAGPKAARRFAPGIVVFLFTVPFWESFRPPLQALTVKVSGGAAGALGIPALIRGDLITIPAGAIRVEGTCAGAAQFIVGLLIATLYAHLFLERWRTRIEAVAVAAAISIVSNWIRVTGLIYIGQHTHMQSPLMHKHQLYGWAIFAAAFLLIFFPFARHLEKRERAGRVHGASPDEATEAPRSGQGGATRWEILVTTALAVLGPLVYFGVGALPATAPEAPLLPSPPSAWRELPASRERPFDWSPGFRDPDASGATGWTNGTAVVYGDWLMYRKERQGRELIGGDNGIAPSSSLLAERSVWLRDRDLWFRQAAVALPDQRVLLVWYWYRVGGVRAVSPAWAKLLELVAFLRRRPASEVVSLSVVCAESDCRDAAATLQEFVRPE